MEQAGFWKQYIDWEATDPQRQDPATLNSRVILANDQAVMCLTHFPEVLNFLN